MIQMKSVKVMHANDIPRFSQKVDKSPRIRPSPRSSGHCMESQLIGAVIWENGLRHPSAVLGLALSYPFVEQHPLARSISLRPEKKMRPVLRYGGFLKVSRKQASGFNRTS
jgi:hypothetical protein